MNGLTVNKSWITVNFLLRTLFSAKFETWAPCKRAIQIIKNYLAAEWTVNKHYEKWSFPNHRLEEKQPTKICLIYGIKRTYAHLKNFYASTTTMTLSQHWKQCINCLLFIKRKELSGWSSGVHFRIWQKFVSASLPVQNFIPLLKRIKACCKRFEEIWLVVLLSSSHVKL